MTSPVLKLLVPLACRIFFSLLYLYIDLLGRWSYAIHGMISSVYGEYRNGEVHCFLFFALFVVSNKKLKIQYQKHYHVYSFKSKTKKPILSHLLPCCHFQTHCNKRWTRNCNNLFMQNWSGICPAWWDSVKITSIFLIVWNLKYLTLKWDHHVEYEFWGECLWICFKC